MDVDLTSDQRDRVELIAIHTGRSAAQVLTDTAEFLLNCEVDYYPSSGAVFSQQFLPDEQLEARFERLLRR